MTEESDIDVDAILAQAYGTGEQQAAPSEPAAPAAPEPREYGYQYKGQEVKIRDNDPKFQQLLSKGHDYEQNNLQLRTERQQWEQQRSEYEKQWAPYKEIDEYARQNPEWWSHVDQAWQQRNAPQAPQNVAPEMQSYIQQVLQQELAGIKQDYPLIKQTIQDAQTAKLEKQRADEDAALAQSMQSLRQKYAGLDFSAQDESGLSLEQRVLNHAIEHGIPTFKAAFLDYYHESLEQQAVARGREAMMKEVEKRKKLGLLDDNTPTSSAQKPFAPGKPRSWNDASLRGEALLKEFNFA